MTLRLSGQTLVDKTLTHQVIFMTRKNVVVISCNCRVAPGKPHETGRIGQFFPDPIGPTSNIEESRRLYNDPANHWTTFTDEDKAKW